MILLQTFQTNKYCNTVTHSTLHVYQCIYMYIDNTNSQSHNDLSTRKFLKKNKAAVMRSIIIIIVIP